ncbi:MAG: HNH endonuclease [Caldilineaceae bacterium]|nr:HNH endonuclease [Caldilineaceae bacterium]
MNPNYPLVALRARHRCEYCQAPESLFNFPFEVEHIIPLARGGIDREDNLALACRSCNVFKASRTVALDAETDQASPLFHPRTQSWAEHFRIDIETATIVGVSATGRVTVTRLRMNSQPQQIARIQWIRLGVFP